jgi:hypothetical protein
LLFGETNRRDEIDVGDSMEIDATMHLFDSSCGDPRAYIYDDYRGDGTLWSSYDDDVVHAAFWAGLGLPPTRYDALVDCPMDTIDFIATIDWTTPLVAINEGTPSENVFFRGTPTQLVTPTVPPGAPFLAGEGMFLPAGVYEVTFNVKTTGVLP